MNTQLKNLILLVSISLTSCSTTKTINNNECKENLKFKTLFWGHIENVENHMFSAQDKTVINSLIFISHYAPVSFQETMNYARIYPNHAFIKDKKVWIEWYEANKCNNIQIKKSYPIPRKYKEFFE